MQGVHMSKLRLHALGADNIKIDSCNSMSIQEPTSVTNSIAGDPADISEISCAMTTEGSLLDACGKVKQQTSLVHLDTDAASSGSTRSSSSGGSNLSAPISTGDCTPIDAVSVLTVQHPATTSIEIQPAADIETAVQPNNPQTQQKRNRRHISWKVINYVVIPMCLPLIAVYWLLCLMIAAAVTFTVLPSLYMAKHLYWACPFIPYIWGSSSVKGKYGAMGSWLMRLNFEGAHCMTVLGRMLTMPIRPHLPDFYILGFPKCGTTSIAGYLKAHPGISGLAGMPGSEIFGKESHFFGGILGRYSTTNKNLYKTFFPTILTRWWCEVVLGVDHWMCFDACPTYACLPHVAARVKAVTPTAKLIVMVRDPAAGVFSAETMLRNMGVPLDWTLTCPLNDDGSRDSRFQFSFEDEAYWAQLESLPADAPLPSDLPQRFYFNLHSYLMAGRYADRLRPWIREFGAESILLVDYQQFVAQPEQTVRAVLHFVGADTSRYDFRPQPARMKGDYKGARIDPGIATWLNSAWFAESNAVMSDILAP